jgi:hypothetical protein
MIAMAKSMKVCETPAVAARQTFWMAVMASMRTVMVSPMKIQTAPPVLDALKVSVDHLVQPTNVLTANFAEKVSASIAASQFNVRGTKSVQAASAPTPALRSSVRKARFVLMGSADRTIASEQGVPLESDVSRPTVSRTLVSVSHVLKISSVARGNASIHARS